MITRFSYIKGVGRYADCSDLGDKLFGRNTILFGQNTAGKSTLTDILWSLNTGNESIIEGRKTFGFRGAQEVELFIGETSYRFPGENWKKGYPGIKIFDSHFINENIFEGKEINFDHQKSLHSIIIGPKGKELAVEINSLQEELDTLTAQKTAKTSEFNKIFKKEITHEKFRKLPRLENPDKRIAELKALIDNANNQAKVKEVFSSIELLINNVTTQNTREILSGTIEVKADLVADHILKTWKNPNASKDFLQTGIELIKDDSQDCAFCGQQLSIPAKELLEAYGKLFSTEYKSLQNQIATAVAKFEKWQPVTFLNSIQDKLSSINLSLNSITSNTKNELTKRKAEVDLAINAKLKELDLRLDFENYQFLIDFFKNLKFEIEDLKKKHVITDEVDIELLREELKQIDFSRTRHTEEWDNFFKEYDAIDWTQEGIKKKRERLREELNQYSADIFSIHLDTINKILQELHADFKICDFQPIRKMVGKTERLFALEFFGQHRVRIDESNLNSPNFKNTLSESDKRVLAFAFFYSMLIHDEDLEHKIVVVDDPFSSFDLDRRTKAAELLINPCLITAEGEMISREAGQFILLTHDLGFFKWIASRLENPKCLRVVPTGENVPVQRSRIEEFDPGIL